MTTPAHKYSNLHDALHQAIQQGAWVVGDQLPTEAVLCQRYQVSRGTVRKAFDLLEQEGLIRREQGRGVFIRARSAAPDFRLIDSLDWQTRTLVQTVQPASEAISQTLALAATTPVIVLEQVRLQEQQPLVYEKRWLAQALCPQLVQDDLDAQPIHQRLIAEYGIRLVKLQLSMEVVALPLAATQVLHLPAGSLGFVIERLTYTLNAAGAVQPAVWYQGYSSHSNYHLQASFHSAF